MLYSVNAEIHVRKLILHFVVVFRGNARFSLEKSVCEYRRNFAAVYLSLRNICRVYA